MSESVTVITSVYGEYDAFPEPPDDPAVDDFVVVTDRHHIGGHARIVVEPRPHMHPRLASKLAKCCPWRYTSADTVIWADAACKWKQDRPIGQLLDNSAPTGLTQFRHPDRQSIVDEARVSTGLRKYDGQNLNEQVRHYLSRGMPHDHGLWACGLIVYQRWLARWCYDGVLNKALEMWMIEQIRWTYQDQISHAYVMWAQAQIPRALPWDLRDNPICEWLPHRRDD